MFKWLGRTYGLGLVVLLVFGVFALLTLWLISIARSLGLRVVSNQHFNTAINVAALLSLPLALGLLLKIHFVRVSLLRLVSVFPIPVISPSAKFALSIIEHANSRDFINAPEVKFWVGGDRWTYGVVMSETMEHESPLDLTSSLVSWCIILGPPTPPLFLTGQGSSVKKSDLIYTGRTAKDTALSVACFFVSFIVDPSKFSVGKPQS